jgi:hypothetical protein
VRQLKKKIRFLRNGLAGETNIHLNCDNPEKVLFQAVLARGDRRLAPVLMEIAEKAVPWKQAMKKNSLHPEQFAVRGYGKDENLPWYVIDHGINHRFLWQEYMKAFRAEATQPCKIGSCRLCGVCDEG